MKRRRTWFDGQHDLDPARLVFIDETGDATMMARLLGYAPHGALPNRRAARPLENHHLHWRTAADGHDRPLVYNGA